jgi:tRNA-modifying protein YgfZ
VRLYEASAARAYTDAMAVAAPPIARLNRGYVEVSGPDAEDLLERMLSNEVASLEVGPEARPALLLTPKGRIIAPLRIVREGAEAFLLITDAAELADPVAETLRRARFASKCEIKVLPWDGFVHFGAEPRPGATRNHDFGVEAFETWGPRGVLHAPVPDAAELETLRIKAATPAWGKELDDSVLPAEAGLDRTHISFTKGCYPGQEPVARLHHRGHPNRHLRRLDVERAEPGADIVWNEKVVGRVTSAVPGHALGYVRREVPDDAVLDIGGLEARLH